MNKNTFAQKLKDSRNTKSQAADLEAKRVKGFKLANVGCSENDTNEYTGPQIASEEALGLALVKAYISADVLQEQISNFSIYSVGKLLATVYPPDFDPPKDDQYLVYGIVTRRGEVRQAAGGKKYVSLMLCDLHYEIGLTIQGAAFDKYYKIRPGTVIAVCNPRLYVTKRMLSTLALSVQSSESAILEIGRAKDLGQCKAEASTTAKRCKNWVNLQTTEVCEYHQEMRARKSASQRPEFNSVATALFDPKDHRRKMAVYKGGSVKWRQGLQLDYQAPGEVHVLSNPFKGEEDDHDRPVKSPSTVKKIEKRKLDRLKQEVELRKKLAKRKDGHMLRALDGEDTQTSRSTVAPFQSEDLKRIGFNPSMIRATAQQRAQHKEMLNGQRNNDYGGDSDSELEIV